jgi:NADH dehydrogenase
VELLRAKATAEGYLQKSGLPYTILASDAFLDTMVPLVVGEPAREGRPVTLVGEGKGRHAFIAACDVAAFAAACVGHPAAMNQRVIIGGPAPVSMRDVVAAYERVLERSIPVQSIAPAN